MAPDRSPSRLTVRGRTVLGLLVAGGISAAALGLRPADVIPSEGGWRVASAFFGRALSPATVWESPMAPGTASLFHGVLVATWTTVRIAAASMALALVLAVPLTFLASRAWWEDDPLGRRGGIGARLRRAVGPVVWAATRVVIGVLRSVHELLWAVLFLSALGLTEASAVLAIAIPYAATLAKVASEMLDEAPREAAEAIRAAGASGLQVFAFGLVPRALPDLASYAFYRFECAVRSAAVLGFFGVETLGLYVRQGFDNARYGEVWTHLWALVAVVLVLEAWSGALRRKAVA